MPNIDLEGAPEIRIGNIDAQAIMFGNRLVWTKPTGTGPFSYYEGFETDLGGWVADSPAIVTRITGAADVGVGSMEMAPGTTGTRRASKALSGLTVGKSYTLSGRLARNSTSGTTANIGIDGLGTSATASMGANAFQTLTYTFTATSTAHTIVLNLVVTSSARRVYLDEVTVSET